MSVSLETVRKEMRKLLVSLLLVLPLVLGGCNRVEENGRTLAEDTLQTDPEAWAGDVVAAAKTLRPHEGTESDWEVFRSTVTWAWDEGLDTIPFGEAVVNIGIHFLGTPYGAYTLELAGEEAVVVNFQEFDCVTYVENVLTLARFIRMQDPEILGSESLALEAYRGGLREIRYRGARVDGYSSRLHYFSDWIRDNEAKGLVREMTQEFGGEEDYKAIDFMTTHPHAYRQLADAANVMAIRESESQLSGLARFKIPEEEIQEMASLIQNGDVIAATSTIDGLDVAHTGLAYWEGSDLHLLHTPLVGGVVEVSGEPLAARILRQDGQDGIRVVRPLDPSGAGGGDTPS